jgi:hypothetical protein
MLRVCIEAESSGSNGRGGCCSASMMDGRVRGRIVLLLVDIFFFGWQLAEH